MGVTLRPAGGGGGMAEESGEVVVEKGEDGVLEKGKEDVVEANPPTNPRTKLTLRQWFPKAVGPTSAAARKAALVTWSA